MDDGAGRWRLWQVPVGIIAVAALGLALAFAPVDVATGQILFDLLVIAVPVALAATVHAAAPRTFGLRRMRITPGRAALWIFLGALLAGIASGIYYALVVVHTQPAVAHEHLRGTQAVLFGLTGVTLVPVAEELFWRGFVHRALRTRMAVGPAVAISASLFGLWHWTGGDPIATVPPRIFFGVVLALLLERTGSLYPGMVAHAYINTGLVVFYVPAVAPLVLPAYVVAVIIAVVVSVNDDRRKKRRRRAPLALAPLGPRERGLQGHTRATGRLGGL
jgi:uncharacterized protein